jgi:hypothetical protein
MFVYPIVLFEQAPLVDLVAELPSSEFYEMCGFYPGQLTEICDNLVLIPNRIECTRTH